MNRQRIIVVGLALAIIAVGVLFGAPGLTPEALAAGGLGVLALGNTVDASEIKSLLEAQGRAWEEFKKANDERLKSIESKGYAPGDIVGKVDVINTDITKLSKSLADVMLELKRPRGEGKGETPEAIEHKQALDTFLRKGDPSALDAIQRKQMNSTDDPNGGYLITAEMDAQIDRVVERISAMARIARTVTIGTRSFKKRVKKSGMSMTRVGEGATAGESAPPSYALIEIVAHPAEVEPWVDNETLEDADIDLAADLAQEAAIAFAEGEGDEFIDGNGVGKARGITSYTNVANASWAWNKIGYVASGKAATFASVAPADKLVDLVHALKPQYRPGASFLMADSVLGTARQMKDGSGQYYLWSPDPTAPMGGRFLGYPVEVDDNMPALASNAYAVAFGNFQRGYMIVRRTGTTLIRDNITAKGTTKFNFRRRFGGGVYNFEAIKLLKMATS